MSWLECQNESRLISTKFLQLIIQQLGKVTHGLKISSAQITFKQLISLLYGGSHLEEIVFSESCEVIGSFNKEWLENAISSFNRNQVPFQINEVFFPENLIEDPNYQAFLEILRQNSSLSNPLCPKKLLTIRLEKLLRLAGN